MTNLSIFSNFRYPGGFLGLTFSSTSLAGTVRFGMRATPSPDRKSDASRLRIAGLLQTGQRQYRGVRCSGTLAHRGNGTNETARR